MEETTGYSNLEQHVKLIDVRDIERIKGYFDSFMIDVAYVDDVTERSIKVVIDAGAAIDLNKPEDRVWFFGLIETVKTECEEPQIIIEIYQRSDNP